MHTHNNAYDLFHIIPYLTFSLPQLVFLASSLQWSPSWIFLELKKNTSISLQGYSRISMVGHVTKKLAYTYCLTCVLASSAVSIYIL